MPKGKAITLDLNGKTIDRGLTAAQTSGEVIRIGSDISGSTTSFTLVRVFLRHLFKKVSNIKGLLAVKKQYFTKMKKKLTKVVKIRGCYVSDKN